jgi:hypothetical protein
VSQEIPVRVNDVAALEGRVTRLENAVVDGFNRLEAMLRQEIGDLKNEQINELRKLIERVSDDQRRAWDAIREGERRDYERSGTNKIISGISHFAAIVFGGVITWFATYLTSGHTHP